MQLARKQLAIASATSLDVQVDQADKIGIQLVVPSAFSGTITFEASIDGTNYGSLSVTPVAGGSAVTSATAAGQWVADCAAYANVRARCSTFTSGSITATLALARTFK
jgi:hypothetical protein